MHARTSPLRQGTSPARAEAHEDSLICAFRRRQWMSGSFWPNPSRVVRPHILLRFPEALHPVEDPVGQPKPGIQVWPVVHPIRASGPALKLVHLAAIVQKVYLYPARPHPFCRGALRSPRHVDYFAQISVEHEPTIEERFLWIDVVDGIPDRLPGGIVAAAQVECGP